MYRQFSKQDIQIATMYMKMSSVSLIITEAQMKTTKKYHHTHIRMDIIKKQKIINVGEHLEKSEHLYSLSGNAKWCSHYGKYYGVS